MEAVKVTNLTREIEAYITRKLSY